MKSATPFVLIALAGALPNVVHAFTSFTLGDLVVSVEGNGVQGATSGAYLDNQEFWGHNI